MGDTVTYTFVVTNTGNVPLTNVTVTDPLVAVLGGPIALAVGDSNSAAFTATYTITQADINAGAVYNLATTTGTPPVGNPVTGTSTDPTPCGACPPNPECTTCTIVPLEQKPSIAITKEGTYQDTTTPIGVTNVGDTVTYTFVVTNTGNVPLTNVTVTDPLVAVLGGPIALAVGDSNSAAFTATYTITQADINAGAVYNLATTTGTPPVGNPVTGTSTDPTPCTGNDCAPVVPSCPDCTITNLPKNPAIIAQNDTFTDIDGAAGNANVGNVLNDNGNGNDTLNGSNAAINQVILTIKEVATSIGGAPVPLVNTSTGEISVPAGTAAGTYTIVYQICESVNQNNCATATVTIDVAVVFACDALVVHNAFSPNGDNKNQYFIIDNITDECYINNSVEIYNRWGVLVFETKNYNNTANVFDGTSKGRTTIKQSEGLPTGTYFYILNYTTSTISGTQTYTKNGYLYLTR